MLNSQLEIISQARTFLSGMSSHHYTHICKPHLSGSIGMHMRHALDHYQALMQGMDSAEVDYNKRHRFSQVELEPSAALESWRSIEQWLSSLSDEQLTCSLEVVSEVAIQTQRSMRVSSTLLRELMFVASHSIHHFSLIAVSCSLQGVKVDSQFGFAPATLTHIRQA